MVKFRFGYLLCIYTVSEVFLYKFNSASVFETGNESNDRDEMEDASENNNDKPELFELLYACKNIVFEQITDLNWADASTILLSSRDGFLSVIKLNLEKDLGEKEDVLYPIGSEASVPKLIDFNFTKHHKSVIVEKRKKPTVQKKPELGKYDFKKSTYVLFFWRTPPLEHFFVRIFNFMRIMLIIFCSGKFIWILEDTKIEI